MSDESARLREEIAYLTARLLTQQEMLEAEAARRIALEEALDQAQDDLRRMAGAGPAKDEQKVSLRDTLFRWKRDHNR